MLGPCLPPLALLAGDLCLGQAGQGHSPLFLRGNRETVDLTSQVLSRTVHNLKSACTRKEGIFLEACDNHAVTREGRYIHKYIYIYTCIYTYLYLNLYPYLDPHVCMYVCMYVCVGPRHDICSKKMEVSVQSP